MPITILFFFNKKKIRLCGIAYCTVSQHSSASGPTTHLTLVREYWTVSHNSPDFGQRVLDVTHNPPDFGQSTGQWPTTHLTLVREYWTVTHNSPDFGQRVLNRSHSVEAPAGCSVGRLPTLSVIWSSSMMVTSTSRSRLIWKASLMDPSSPLLLNSTMASVRLGHFLAPGKNNNQKAIKGNSHWSSKTVN